MLFWFKQKTAYEMRISDWSSDVCSSDPNTLRAAPHSLAATITMNEASGSDAKMTRALLAAFPSVSIIAVSEVVAQVTVLLGQMATAIVMAGSVAILAGIAVLIGAIAASRQARACDSGILKTLGATPWQIVASQALEYRSEEHTPELQALMR